jgi:hypothetical protein
MNDFQQNKALFSNFRTELDNASGNRTRIRSAVVFGISFSAGTHAVWSKVITEGFSVSGTEDEILWRIE